MDQKHDTKYSPIPEKQTRVSLTSRNFHDQFVVALVFNLVYSAPRANLFISEHHVSHESHNRPSCVLTCIHWNKILIHFVFIPSFYFTEEQKCILKLRSFTGKSPVRSAVNFRPQFTCRSIHQVHEGKKKRNIKASEKWLGSISLCRNEEKKIKVVYVGQCT